jgi:hypothetical protein
LSLPFRIRMVPLSYLSPQTNYAFRGFTPFLKQITVIIPQTRSQQLPSTYPPFHCSLMTPSLNPTWYKLLTESLNNRQLRSSFIFLDCLTLTMNYDPSRPLFTIDTPYIPEDEWSQQHRCNLETSQTAKIVLQHDGGSRFSKPMDTSTGSENGKRTLASVANDICAFNLHRSTVEFRHRVPFYLVQCRAEISAIFTVFLC